MKPKCCQLVPVLLGALFGSMAFFSGQVHAQNLIQNGGFEFGLTSGPDSSYFSPSTYGAWNKFSTHLLGMPYFGRLSYEGQESMLLGYDGNTAPGQIWQSFATRVGETYRVSFAVNGYTVGIARATVYNTAGTNILGDVTSPGNGGWRSGEFNFDATSSQTSIALKNISGGSIVDDVRIVEVKNFRDGGFELGLTSGPGTFVHNRPAYGEWTSSGNPALLGMPFGGLPPYEGTEAMHVGNNFGSHAVTQQFETTTGQKYWVSLAVIGWGGGVGTVRTTVSNLFSTNLEADLAAPGGNEWGTAVYEFTALASPTTITIQNISGACTIDDVRISTTPPDFALKFDGVDDHVAIPGFGNQMPTTEITVEFWQWVGSAKAQSTFSCNANAFNAHIPWSNGQVYWDFGGRRLQYTPPVPIVGTWQHFALVSSVASQSMIIYRNGVAEAALPSNAGTFTRGNFDLLIGRNAAGYFEGAIDEFRIWNVARTQGQLTANINTRLAGNEAGLVAYYRMDEGSGTTVLDATTPAYSGTLVGGTKRVRSTVPECGLATQELDLATLTPSTRHYSYGGYQGAGIDFNLVLPTSVTNTFLAVTNLCYDITPVAGATGVVLNRLLGQNLSLDYDGGVWATRTTGSNAAGLRVESAGSNGSRGPDGVFTSNNGGAGSRGGDAGTSTVSSKGIISTMGAGSSAILAVSQGGRGGDGGDGYNNPLGGDNDGGPAGGGGDAKSAAITGSGNLVTTGNDSVGVLALSRAGQGGNGGEGHAAGEGGNGGIGGDGGAAVVDGTWTINTLGTAAYGISARSLGGAGGASGSSGWIDGDGGNGGGSGDGALAMVNLGPGGSIETSGADAHGIFAQSIGGFAGGGGSGDSVFSSSGGSGGSAGHGGNVLVSNEGTILTRGLGANALFAESVGGGGGSGGAGSGLFNGGGGNSSAGGNGGLVTIDNFGSVETENQFARGIFAQSVGAVAGTAPPPPDCSIPLVAQAAKAGTAQRSTFTTKGRC